MFLVEQYVTKVLTWYKSQHLTGRLCVLLGLILTSSFISHMLGLWFGAPIPHDVPAVEFLGDDLRSEPTAVSTSPELARVPCCTDYPCRLNGLSYLRKYQYELAQRLQVERERELAFQQWYVGLSAAERHRDISRNVVTRMRPHSPWDHLEVADFLTRYYARQRAARFRIAHREGLPPVRFF